MSFTKVAIGMSLFIGGAVIMFWLLLTPPVVEQSHNWCASQTEVLPTINWLVIFMTCFIVSGLGLIASGFGLFSTDEKEKERYCKCCGRKLE